MPRSPRPGHRAGLHRVLVILLALTFFATAPWSTAVAETRLKFELSNSAVKPVHDMEAFDTPGTAIGDFDRDGHMEIVAQNDNQYVYVLSTKEARLLAELKPDYPSNWGVRPINDPAVADVDGDGNLDIIVVTSAASTCVFSYDPEGSTSTKFEFTKKWCKRADKYDGDKAAADGGPFVADVDGDGKMEIFMQTEDRGLFAWNHDGTLRWSQDTWGGNAGPLVADLQGDGKPEAIFFDDGGGVRVYDGDTGKHRWTYWAGKEIWPASIPVAGNAADLDGDGKMEIVFFARDATHYVKGELDQNRVMMFVLDHNGNRKWSVRPEWANPLGYTHPILYDVDGDGKREIIAQDWNTMGHKPGAWEKTGKANVFAYNYKGDLLWRTVVDNTWSNDDLALADMDGDGDLEVLAIGYNSNGQDGVWYIDAITGKQEKHVAFGDWQASRGPLVGDFDGSGKTSWAIPVHRSSKGGAFIVFETDAKCAVAYGGWQYPDPCRGGTPPKPKPGTKPPVEDTPPKPREPSFSDTDAWWAYRWEQARGNTNVSEVTLAETWHGLTFREWASRKAA